MLYKKVSAKEHLYAETSAVRQSRNSSPVTLIPTTLLARRPINIDNDGINWITPALNDMKYYINIKHESYNHWRQPKEAEARYLDSLWTERSLFDGTYL